MQERLVVRPRFPTKRLIATALAVLVAASVVPLRASAQVPAFPSSFRTQRITTNGVTIHVRVGGTGPAVVLLHGYGETGDMWAPLAARLAPRRTVIVPDLRGMGLSSHPASGYEKLTQAVDLAGVLDTLGVDRIELVAHDIGNMVAYAFAAKYRGRVSKLAVLDAPVPGIGPWQEILRNPLLWHFRFGGPDMERLVRGRERIYLDRFWNEFSADPKRFGELSRQHYARLYARPGAMRSGFEQFKAFDRDAQDNQELLAAGPLEMPVLAVGGERSFGATMAAVMRFAASNVQEGVIPRAGHWLMEENPDATVDAVAAFLDSRASATVTLQGPERSPEDPKLIWTPASVVLVKKEVAPNVFAVYPDDAAAKNAAGIPAATSGGFIVGERGVLVVESMINRRLANQLLALIRATTAKPILYVVNTSYHGDHSYGNQFFPAGTQLIQHAETQAYIRDHFRDDVAFMKRFFGTNQGMDELEGQPAHLTLDDGAKLGIDLGGKRVEIMHLGFAQTKGDLFVWLPAEKVLYTGNPIIAEGPSTPWLLDGKADESLATMRRLRAMVPRDVIVVPGHGAPASIAAIEAPVRYLEQLTREVGRAVSDRLTEAQTVERLAKSMSAYSAYRIFPWVHSQLNVPKTYQEYNSRSSR
jgi:pimeloyl-ACP methyl ester carboxylesterase/glyoxylase-like metal-dependent hydrolase (beta-lactamase superfamily II)